MLEEMSPVPAHVPAALVHEFDMFLAPELEEEPHHRLRKLHREAPEIFWTTANGGHWVVTRAAAGMEMMREVELFSYDPKFNAMLDRYPRLNPLQYDPPEHTAFRRILNPWFTPAAVIRREQEVRDLAVDLIEGVLARGNVEFVSEIAELYSVTVFMRIVNAPMEDRTKLLDCAMRWTREPDQEAREQGLRDLAAYQVDLIAQRRANPGDDLFSQIVAAEVGGRGLTEDELIGMGTMVFLGGLDTVAGMLSYVMCHLARNPEQYRQLVDNPSIIARACEEMMRAFGVANTERGATGSFKFRGVQFERGDRIVLLPQLFGIDDELYEDPERIDFDRKIGTPIVFGAGSHRCVGAQLARTEIRVFLEEWTRRIPAYMLETEHIRSRGGIVWSPITLPLAWAAK